MKQQMLHTRTVPWVPLLGKIFPFQSSLETEYRILLRPRDYQVIFQKNRQKIQTEILRNTYWDTPDFLLSQKKIRLRVRETATERRITLKLPYKNSSSDLWTKKREYETITSLREPVCFPYFIRRILEKEKILSSGFQPFGSLVTLRSRFSITLLEQTETVELDQTFYPGDHVGYALELEVSHEKVESSSNQEAFENWLKDHGVLTPTQAPGKTSLLLDCLRGKAPKRVTQGILYSAPFHCPNPHKTH